jgi:hypothetical protein
MRRDSRALALVLALAAMSLPGFSDAAEESWTEAQVPLPVPLRLDRLIPVDVSSTELRFGVVPDSVTIGTDGVVRYVIVASGASGTVNAIHEGIRCSTWQVKVYARHNGAAGWQAATNAAWQPLSGNGAQRHSMQVARTAACIGEGTNLPAANVVRALSAPASHRFGSVTQ